MTLINAIKIAALAVIAFVLTMINAVRAAAAKPIAACFSPMLQIRKALMGIFVATLILVGFPFLTPSVQAAECKDGLELRGLLPDDEHHLKFFGKKETPANRMQCREIIRRHHARQWQASKCFDIAANPIARVKVNGITMELLTDTGASRTLLSFEQASKAGVTVTGKKTFTLADGSEVEFSTGRAYIAVGARMGNKFPVSIGDGEGLLGNDVIRKFACRK